VGSGFQSGRYAARVIRRIVIWTAACVLALCLPAWIVSQFNVVRISTSRVVGLARGTLWIAGGQPQFTQWYVYGLNGELTWRPTFDRKRGEFVLPLWMPAAAAVLVLAPTWCVGHQRRRSRQRAGQCATCGYDLNGMTGRCPECGKPQERGA